MKKFLILAIACTMACLVHAQTPTKITYPKQTKFNLSPPETPCNNFAGTFTLGQSGVNTQSNDLTLDTIWLCHGDSIFINHNGDFNLSGDPEPATAPGIGYAYYTCPPTVTGPTLQNIVGAGLPNPLPGDPCRLQDTVQANAFELLVTSGNANGDTWLFNNGNLQNTFNMGKPMLVHFAPVTFDDASNNGYEVDPLMQGSAPGPCVNVNTAAQFEVVYLNPITAVGFTNPFNGNSCLGRFRLEGGYPEWDLDATYTSLDIYLKSDPTVKALVNNSVQQIKHGVSLIFSVPQSGTYVIEVEDGKSCGLKFEVNMTACTNTDNVVFNLQSVEAPPGGTVCIPITTQNFTNIQGFSTSICWDPNLVQLQPGAFIQNINADLLADFDPNSPGNVETTLIGQGYLGILYSGSGNATLTSTETLLEICFLVLSQEDSICTPVTFSNQPSAINAINSAGATFAFEGVPGEICIVYDTVAVDVDILTPNCNGTTNISVTVTGGEAPYEVSWQLQPSGPTPSVNNIAAGIPFNIPNLPPGTYKIIATPQDGIDIVNADTSFFTIVSATLGAALDLSILPSCNGDTDGSVAAIVFEGSNVVTNFSNYTFNWSPASVPDPGMPVQNPVPSGQYSVTVTQVSTGCTAVAAGFLPNPPVLDNGVVDIVQATCTGLADGSISYEIDGGTPNSLGQYNIIVKYSETSGDPNAVQVDATLGNPWVNTALLPGFYTFEITDDNGCTLTDEVFLAAQFSVTLNELTTSYVEPSCNGGDDGQIGVSVTVFPTPPGGANFTFAWLPIGGTTVCNPSECTYSDITAGTYTVTAVDNIGCSASLTIELNEPPAFTVSPLSVVNPSCPNPSGGSINVSGFGGTGLPSSFTYSWSDMGTGSSRSGLMEGTYTVTATDANGCTAVYDTTIALPAPPAITGITQIDVRCGGDGSLTVNAPTAVSYNWTSSNGPLPNPTSASINNLDGGIYSVIVTDAVGCTNVDTVTLAGVEPLIFSDTTLNTPTCNGYNDGSIAVGVEGGTPGYTFNWNPVTVPPNSPIALTLVAGIYEVTVTDSKLCTLVGQFTLTEPPVITALVLEPGTITTDCFGSCDATATLAVSYLPGSNFNFSWDNGTIDSIRTDLCTGLNTVTITETSPAQCFLIFEVNVSSPPQITLTPESKVTNVRCFGDTNGSIGLSVAGGNGGPYSFAWQTPPGGNTSTIQNLAPGTYVATVTDIDGCTQEFSSTVGEPAPVVVTIDNANTLLISCFGEEDGTLAVLATGGTPGISGYTYAWSDGANQIGNTNPIAMIGAGDYQVTVTDSLQCTGSTTLTLFDPPQVNGSFTLGAPLQCFGDETTITITDIQGGQGAPYLYTIDFGVPLDPTFTSNISGGEHYITYIDQQNCETTDTIDVPEPPQITVTFDPASIEIQLGDSLTLSPFIQGAVVSTFEWMPADFLKNADTLQPVLYTFESGTLMLTVFDDKGCMGKGSLKIEVDPNRNVYIPNVFIPGNSLGLNDFFTPYVGLGVEKINYFRVYDRWGEQMYGRDNFLPSDLELTSGWDGRFKGKFVEPGVYVYAAEVIFLDKKVLLYRGDVTVVR